MMHIIGTAFYEFGKFYYVLKNSWGKQGPYKGLIYMSEDYFRAKTVSVLVVRNRSCPISREATNCSGFSL